MSAPSRRFMLVDELGHSEVLDDMKLLIEGDIGLLKEVAEEKTLALGAFLAEIGSARNLSELEGCEQRASLELAALVGELDEVVDRLRKHVGTAGGHLIEKALQERLDDIAGREESCSAANARIFAPSSLVVRMREFLAGAERLAPSREVAQQKLTLARTALQALRTTQETDDVSDALRELDGQEIEDLSSLVVDLTLLVGQLSNRGPVPSPTSLVRQVRVSSKVPRSAGPASAGCTTDASTPEKKDGVVPLAPEAVARYEEDYHKHQGIFQTLRGTASTDEHRRELLDFEQLLNHRREELSVWRKQGGYTGHLPLFLADTFEGALPGESHVRGSNGKQPKKKNAAKVKRDGQRSNRKNRRKKRRGVGRGVPFEVWAANSWGKDPDDTPRERNVVLGGAMESNRSRH